MYKYLNFVLVSITGLFMPSTANAIILYESAIKTNVDCTAWSWVLAPDQFLGTRFRIDTSTTITGVGGLVCGATPSDNFFAALLRLPGPTGLPDFNPSDVNDYALATATFIPGDSGDDIHIPLNLTLGPGDYGLVFGSGLLGTSGLGWMPAENTDLSGVSYFHAAWDIQSGLVQWAESDFGGLRFFVTAIPEPSTALLMFAGLGLLPLLVRRSSKK